MSDDISNEHGHHEHPLNDGKQGIQGIQGVPGDSPTSELLLAVRDLTEQVKSLTERLEKEYPKREEVVHEGRKRAVKTLIFGLVVVLATQFLTLGTVSYCFLSPSGTTHNACKIIPGYEATTELGKKRLERFELLIKQIEENQQDIRELQEQLRELR